MKKNFIFFSIEIINLLKKIYNLIKIQKKILIYNLKKNEFSSTKANK
jgi:hypothetical protein